MSSHLMPLSFGRPPLNQNQRLHWAAKARIVKRVRDEACVRARAARLGKHKHITVQLHYQPDRSIKKRDRANIHPTQKALLDGLVDAGLVPDDCDTYVDEQMPVIHPKVPGEPAKCWLEITY